MAASAVPRRSLPFAVPAGPYRLLPSPSVSYRLRPSPTVSDRLLPSRTASTPLCPPPRLIHPLHRPAQVRDHDAPPDHQPDREGLEQFLVGRLLLDRLEDVVGDAVVAP